MQAPSSKSHAAARLLFRRLLALPLVLAFAAGAASAQSDTDGTTPSGLAPGSPAGAYPLSGFEDVNLFNGNLNFHLPLVTAGGRGGARHAMTLPIDQRWTVETSYNDMTGGYSNSPEPYWWPGIRPGYGPGVLQARHAGDGSARCGVSPGYYYVYTKTLTRLTFTTADGTEHELRDQKTGGQPQPKSCASYNTPYNRGRVFVSADGSSVTFISDADITDLAKAPGTEGGVTRHSGFLLMRDGTRYRIDDGTVTWMRDRNGNLLSFGYDANKRVTAVTDPLGRQVTVAYDQAEGGQYGTCDRLSFTGFGGAARVLRVCKTNLGAALRTTRASDVTTPQTPKALFPELNGSNFTAYDPTVVGSIWLPDGQQRYQLFYNQYGELARVVLPTGGAIEYDHTGGYVSGNADGVVGTGTGRRAHIYRRVVERRVYPDGASLENRTTYSRPESYVSGVGYTTAGYVAVEQFDSANARKASERHYFNGMAHSSFSVSPNYYNSWLDGREYKTESLDPADGATPLRRVENTWRQRAPVSWWDSTQGPEPANDPRMVTTVTTIEPNGANLVSKTTAVNPGDPSGQTVGFDRYNNPTEAWEYDFGPQGTAGALLRHTQTVYVTTNTVGGATYDYACDPATTCSNLSITANVIHQRDLVLDRYAYSVNPSSGAEVLAARNHYEYDQSGLTDRAGITGLCTTYAVAQCSSANSTLYRTRGNLTGETMYASAAASAGPVTSTSGYDIAGNVVSTTDALGNVSQISYADSFCNGAGCGGTFTPNTYAFPTSRTLPAPDASAAYGYAAGTFGSTSALSSSAVYDFSTGLVYSSTDANNQTTRMEYNDPLERATAQVRPGATGGRTDITFAPDGRSMHTSLDLDATRRTESYQYFDGLGRPYRSQQYEGSDASKPWVNVDTQYDALGRVRRESMPYRSAGGGTPLTSAEWSAARRTETSYDSMGRVLAVTSQPYGAALYTDYSGDLILAKDPAGKERVSRLDALGRLTQVWEVTAAESGGEASTVAAPAFPGHPEAAYGYLTSYRYDALGNLRMVEQAGQHLGAAVTQRRFFAYDSLGRLVRLKNPEQGNMTADADFPALTDSSSGTSNSQWSAGYSYDANGNLAKRKDARGVVTTFAYDHLNRNIITSYANDPAQTPTGFRHYDGALNGLGRFWYSSAGPAATIINEYDSVGRIREQHQIFQTNGVWSAPYSVQRSYNKAGGLVSQTYPSGRTVTYNYDAAGRLGDYNGQPAFAGNLGDGVTRTYASEVRYHELGGMEQERFGTQTPVYNKSLFNSRGQLAEIRVSTYSLTSAGHETDWNRGAIINHYSTAPGAWGASGGGPENNGNLLKQELYLPHDDQISGYTNVVQEYGYDSLNRVNSVFDKPWNGSADFYQLYKYDRWGNRTVDPGSLNAPAPQFAVDAATNRLGVPPNLSGRMDYDAAGNLVNDAYSSYGTADGTPTRIFDAEGRMTTVKNSALQAVSSYAYDADGRRVRRAVSGQETWQVYGVSGELLAEYAAGAAPAQPRKEYGYRGGKLLVTAEAPAGGGGQAGNVAAAANGASAVGSTSYDPYGLYSSNAINGSRTYAGSYWNDLTAGSFPDWLQINFSGQKTVGEIDVFFLQDNYATAAPTETMTFTQMGITAFDVQYWTGSQWVTAPGGSVTGNNKVWRKFTFPAVTTDKIRVVVNGASDVWSRIVEVEAYAPGTADLRWLVADQVGTPRMVIDQTGSLAAVRRHDYYPFGEEVPADVNWRKDVRGYLGDAVRQKFTGYERDAESGLDYAQARYFVSSQGRFASVDPLLASARPRLPQSWNRYAYCLNSPLRYVDSIGLIWGQYTDKEGTIHLHWYETEKEMYAFGATRVTDFIQHTSNEGIILLNPDGPTFTHISLWQEFKLRTSYPANLARSREWGEWWQQQFEGINRDLVGSGLMFNVGGVLSDAGVYFGTFRLSAGGEAAEASVAARTMFTVEDAVSSGLVNHGGKLEEVLTAIQEQYVAKPPGSLAEGLGVISRATSSVGLEPGTVVSGTLTSDKMTLLNVGNITTTISSTGEIVVSRGSDILLLLSPK